MPCASFKAAPLSAVRAAPAWAGRFVVSNLGLVAEREGDVVESFEKAVAAEVVYRERGFEVGVVADGAASGGRFLIRLPAA